MSRSVSATPISQSAFSPFGQIIATKGVADKMINQGNCERHHDLAELDFGDGRAGISLFKSATFSLPFKLELMERHPEGSQAFIPMNPDPFLVVVAADNRGQPDIPQAFVVSGGQGVNIGRNIWHGVLCPLAGSGLFAVVDRIGDGPNLQEFWFDEPLIVTQG